MYQLGLQRHNVQMPRGKREHKTTEELNGVATASTAQMGSLTGHKG